MRSLLISLLFCLSLIYQNNVFASDDCPQCCAGYGGIRYNDSSSGRFVCGNGYFSQCYSTRHAIMDLQKLKGCCLWEGGILKITFKGQVICRDGHVSEVCSRLLAGSDVTVF
jgi:hypothetical protein